jgi:hypothetical protein
MNQIDTQYQILPFSFERFNEQEYFLTNDVGKLQFLENDDFNNFVNGHLDKKVIPFTI